MRSNFNQAYLAIKLEKKMKRFSQQLQHQQQQQRLNNKVDLQGNSVTSVCMSTTAHTWCTWFSNSTNHFGLSNDDFKREWF